MSNKYYDNLLREAERIMHAEHKANGYDDHGTCVLGAGIEVGVRVVIPQVSQGNMSAYAAAKPAIEFLQEHGISARWHDGRMD